MRHTKSRKDTRGSAAANRKEASGFPGVQIPTFSFYKPAKRLVSVSPLFFPEPASDIQEVNRIWRWPQLDDEFTRVGDIVLRYRDVRTLREDGWLNDEVINAYINLLSLHCPDVLLLNTFFLEILKQKSPSGSIPLEKVHRVLQRRGVSSLFALQKVIIPVNIDNRHWVCYCIDHSNQEITYYDSLPLPETTAGTLIAQYVEKEMEALGVLGKRVYQRRRAECARQYSESDCGVFALVNIRNCAMRTQMEAEQSLMLRVRRMVTLELKQGRIL